MFASFNRFRVEMTLDQAESASHPRSCDEDVAQLLTDPKIRRQLKAIGPEPIRAELKEYGAWNDEELANEKENDARIIWIAAGNIAEEIRQ